MKHYTFTILSFFLAFGGVKAQTFSDGPSDNQQVPAKGYSDCNSLRYDAPGMSEFIFNTRCRTESYPFLSADGQHLYYTNNQDRDWIYYTYVNTETSEWTAPVAITIDGLLEGSSLNSCYLTADMNTMYITGDGKLYRCTRKEGVMNAFTNLEQITVKDRDKTHIPFTCISFTPDMQEMTAYTATEDAPMCRYRWIDDLTIEFAGEISSTKREIGTLSFDGLRYYYTNDEHKNVLFMRRRDKLGEDFSSQAYICKTFGADLNINQVRTDGKEDKFAIVLSSNNWNNNDLFFWRPDSAIVPVPYATLAETSTGNTSSYVPPVMPSQPVAQTGTEVTKVEKKTPVKYSEIQSSLGSSVYKAEIGQPYPNPANNVAHCYYKVDPEVESPGMLPTIIISDQSGKSLMRVPLKSTMGEAKLDVSSLADGIYLIGLEYLSINSPTVKLYIGR